MSRLWKGSPAKHGLPQKGCFFRDLLGGPCRPSAVLPGRFVGEPVQKKRLPRATWDGALASAQTCRAPRAPEGAAMAYHPRRAHGVHCRSALGSRPSPPLPKMSLWVFHLLFWFSLSSHCLPAAPPHPARAGNTRRALRRAGVTAGAFGPLLPLQRLADHAALLPERALDRLPPASAHLCGPGSHREAGSFSHAAGRRASDPATAKTFVSLCLRVFRWPWAKKRLPLMTELS